MSTVITINIYLYGLPSHHQCRGYGMFKYIYIYIYTYIYVRVCVCVCVCVKDSETDNCGIV